MPTAAAVRRPRIEDLAVREKLFEQWQPLAYRLAAKLYAMPYIRRIGTLADVKQEARIGLLKAIDGFDPSRGVQFITYAWASIERHVQRRAQCSGIVRLPIAKQMQPDFVARSVHQLPEDYEIRPGHDGRRAKHDMREMLDSDDERRFVQGLVRQLPPRLRRPLVLRFGLDGRGPRTMQQISRELEMSEFFIKKALAKGIERLQRRFVCAEQSRRLRLVLQGDGCQEQRQARR